MSALVLIAAAAVAVLVCYAVHMWSKRRGW